LSLDADVLPEQGIVFRETGSTAANQQRYWLIRYTPPACRIKKLPAPTCHHCSRWENNSCWFVWKFKAHNFGLHNFATWTAHSAFWTAQNWLHCTVGICPGCAHLW